MDHAVRQQWIAYLILTYLYLGYASFRVDFQSERQPAGVGFSSEQAQLVAGAYLVYVATDDPARGVRELRSLGARGWQR